MPRPTPHSGAGVSVSGNPTQTVEWAPGTSCHLPLEVAFTGAALCEQRARGSSWSVLGRAPQRWTLNALNLPGLPASPDNLPSQAQTTS